MKIINPSVELWKQNDPKQHVARCARICYNKNKGDDEVTIKNLLNRKHYSVFRHETVYAAVRYMDIKDMFMHVNKYMECPYIKWIIYGDYVYFVTNGHFMIDTKKNNPVLYKWINENIISEEEAKECYYIYEHFMRYTFCIITQISTSRELNRVSPNNIAEQSTRYVYEDGSICKPHWMDKDKIDYINNNSIKYPLSLEDDEKIGKEYHFLKECARSFAKYKLLINEYNLHRQDARGILPLDTATKCVYTYSINEWRKILDLRYYGTTGKPHENAKIIASMIRNELIKLGYDFRN